MVRKPVGVQDVEHSLPFVGRQGLRRTRVFMVGANTYGRSSHRRFVRLILKRGPLLRTWFTTWVAGVISSSETYCGACPVQVTEDGTEVAHRPLKKLLRPET